MTTAPVQPHINDEFALNLQNQGASLTRVAKELFGYQIVTVPGDSEAYIVSPLTQGFTSVVRNERGLELAESPFRGKKLTNAIDFVRDHNPDIKSTLDAVDYIRTGLGMNKTPKAA